MHLEIIISNHLWHRIIAIEPNIDTRFVLFFSDLSRSDLSDLIITQFVYSEILSKSHVLSRNTQQWQLIVKWLHIFFKSYTWKNIDDQWWIPVLFMAVSFTIDTSRGRQALSDEHTKHVLVFAERFPVAARRRFARNTPAISWKNRHEIKRCCGDVCSAEIIGNSWNKFR